jgi:glycosyltransferase involved in cell wall biosynthesis
MITIGIPTYNEEKVIEKTIHSVLTQISLDDEVIVVASGCTDNTVPLIQNIAKKDARVRLIEEEERNGKASALNLIIQNASSDIIVQTDGDVVLEQGAISRLIRHFDNPKIGGVSGNPVALIPKSNLLHDWTMMSYRKIGEVRQAETAKGVFWHLSGYLLAFRKKALPNVPFAKGAVDAWMGRIIQKNGYSMVYEANAKVFVKAPLTIKDFIAQKARVRAGYYLIPKGPRTVRREALWLPKELFKIPFMNWHRFILSGTVYLYSWLKGWYLAKSNKSLKEIWKVPESTKK